MKGDINAFTREIKDLGQRFDNLNVDELTENQKQSLLNGSTEEMKATINEIFKLK